MEFSLRRPAAKKVNQGFFISRSLRPRILVLLIAIRINRIRVLLSVSFPWRMRRFVKTRWLGNCERHVAMFNVGSP